MRTMILAAIAALTLGVGVANAQSYSHSMPPSPHSTNQTNW